MKFIFPLLSMFVGGVDLNKPKSWDISGKGTLTRFYDSDTNVVCYLLDQHEEVAISCFSIKLNISL